jgi:FtsH-binding integral membrane protein
MINLGVLYWKRHSHPANLFLLSSFTLLEAFTIGIAISFYSQIVILKALYVLFSCIRGSRLM